MNRRGDPHPRPPQPRAPLLWPGAGLGAVGLATSPPSEGRCFCASRRRPHAVSPDRGPHGYRPFAFAGLGFSVVRVHMRGCRGTDAAHCSGSFRLAASCLGFSDASGVSGAQVAGRQGYGSVRCGLPSDAREVPPLGHRGERGQAVPGSSPAPAPQRVRGSLSVAGVVGLVASPRASWSTRHPSTARGPSRHQARGQCGGGRGRLFPEPSRGLWDTGQGPQGQTQRFFVMEAMCARGFSPAWAAVAAENWAVSRGLATHVAPQLHPDAGPRGPACPHLHLQCQWPYSQLSRGENGFTRLPAHPQAQCTGGAVRGARDSSSSPC